MSPSASTGPKRRRRAAADPDSPPVVTGMLEGNDITLHDGAVVIAAITSCTNTSNPSVMIGAGLARQEGGRARPQTKPWVKTQPGAGLPGRHRLPRGIRAAAVSGRCASTLVGYGCTTCIGNSGPLPEVIAQVDRRALAGHRGGAERQPELRGAACIRRCAPTTSRPRRWSSPSRWRAGSTSISRREPLGKGKDGKPVFLRTSGHRRRRSGDAMAELAQAGAVRAAATARCSRATRPGRR